MTSTFVILKAKLFKGTARRDAEPVEPLGLSGSAARVIVLAVWTVLLSRFVCFAVFF